MSSNTFLLAASDYVVLTHVVIILSSLLAVVTPPALIVYVTNKENRARKKRYEEQVKREAEFQLLLNELKRQEAAARASKVKAAEKRAIALSNPLHNVSGRRKFLPLNP